MVSKTLKKKFKETFKLTGKTKKVMGKTLLQVQVKKGKDKGVKLFIQKKDIK